MKLFCTIIIFIVLTGCINKSAFQKHVYPQLDENNCEKQGKFYRFKSKISKVKIRCSEGDVYWKFYLLNCDHDTIKVGEFESTLLIVQKNQEPPIIFRTYDWQLYDNKCVPYYKKVIRDSLGNLMIDSATTNTTLRITK